MFVKQKDRVFIRILGNICYLQNRATNTDIMFAGSAKEFVMFLSREPQDIDIIIDKICKIFYKTDKDIIKKDVLDFYNKLDYVGMITQGNTINECIEKDTFNYEMYDSEIVKFENNKKRLTDLETNVELHKYLKNNPTIMSFQIEIASCCNERCLHCYIPHEEKNQVMSYEMYERVLKELNKMGTIGLVLSGGEPMINPHFVDFLKLANKYDFAVSILTNLTLLNEEILDEIKKLRQVSIQTSLYSMDPSIHDTITQLKGSFYKTKSAIETLVKNNIIVQVSCPALKLNKDSFKDVIKWCNDEMKIRAHTDYAIMAESNGSQENLKYRLSLDETREYIYQLIECDKSYQDMLKKIDISKSRRDIDPESNPCGIGIDSAAMNVYGDVIPCSGFESLKCGNINERSLLDIWKNSEVFNMLRNLRMKDYPQCLNCENNKFCSLCIKRHEGETGSIHKLAHHFCEVARINKEVVENWSNKI